MKWFEVEDYPSLEMSEQGHVKVKEYVLFKGTRRISCKKRMKQISRRGEFFVSESGWNVSLNVKNLKRGKQIR